MIGKQLVTLFVLTLFVFSIPVFAQEDATGTEDGSRVQHGKDISIVQTTKDKVENANDKYRESRTALQSKRAEVQDCEASTTVACEATTREYVQHQVQYLKSVRDRIEANLDLLKYYAENYIDDSEQRTRTLNHIKDIKDNLRETYAQIDEADTLAEAKAIRDDLVSQMKVIKQAVKEYNAETRRAKLHSLNTKLKTLYTKANHVIDLLESKGANLGDEYPAKVAVLNEALANAEENLELARSLYGQIRWQETDVEKEALIAQVKNYADKAREDLKNAKDHLKDLMNSIRNRVGNEEFETAVAQA